ncbi:L-histidine N(alpha)-methyltransferase [Pedobacter immunditicola]|uniref:L-histidine N(alpha)-methyltransferase n=1 Tax=Pedobacter immunditicola TaxID=3133440 RepID=UPI0030AD1A6E
MDQFLKEVLDDLRRKPKKLNPKYFYDEAGDKLFQQIMNSEEYYPTNCELEIFQEKTEDLATVLKNGFDDFDLIEMGAGDATKSSYLLKELVRQQVTFTYRPIDISTTMIEHLESTLEEVIRGLKVEGLNGEYFQMLKHVNTISKKKKVILFLGGNIGNFEVTEANAFCRQLKSYLQPGDLVLIGFDLKKHPAIIRAAYNDKEGFTKEFNLNLLRRINRELGADFETAQFEHYPSYDPATGECRSYLISLKDQVIHLAGHKIFFAENEFISMEISQKYSVEETDQMALRSGFIPVKHFLDSKRWFLDAVWQV